MANPIFWGNVAPLIDDFGFCCVFHADECFFFFFFSPARGAEIHGPLVKI